MRVIVTRPARPAKETVEKLRAAGHLPLLMPLARPEHDPAALAHALLAQRRALVITSAEALEALSTDDLSHLRGETLYAVGKATASAAVKAGFKAVRTGPGTGAGLAHMIAEEQRWSKAAPLLYLAGNPRAGEFEAALADRQIPCLIAEIYRMVPVDYDRDAFDRLCGGETPDAALFYSAEAARNFFALSVFRSEAPPRSLRLFCLGPRIADTLPKAFRENAIIAPSPEEDLLLSMI